MADTLVDVCHVGMSFYLPTIIFYMMLRDLLFMKSIFIHFLLPRTAEVTALWLECNDIASLGDI